MSACAEGLRGSCLCGAVGFVLTAAPRGMAHCHCGMCRKHHGTAYATFVEVDASAWRVLRGAEHIVSYPSSPGVERRFCGRCGGKLTFTMQAHPQALWLAAGALDDALELTPGCHIFVASKAPWYAIDDGLPCHDAYPTDALET